MARTNITLTGNNFHATGSDSLGTKLAEHDGALDKLEGGIIPSARLNFATNPSNTNTVTIDGHVFTFLTTPIAATTYTQIVIGANAAATLALFVKAINGVADPLIVPATTPHTLSLLADAVTATSLRIRTAASQGGAVAIGAKTSLAVSETLANAADVWDRANLNATGRTLAPRFTSGTIIISTQMIAAGAVFIELPFTPVDFAYSARSATGAALATSDLVTISSDALKIALEGSGGAADLVNTDIVSFWAST